MAGCGYNRERRLFTKVIAWLATAKLRGQVMGDIRLTGFSLTMDNLKMTFFLKYQLAFLNVKAVLGNLGMVTEN